MLHVIPYAVWYLLPFAMAPKMLILECSRQKHPFHIFDFSPFLVSIFLFTLLVPLTYYLYDLQSLGEVLYTNFLYELFLYSRRFSSTSNGVKSAATALTVAKPPLATYKHLLTSRRKTPGFYAPGARGLWRSYPHL